MSKHRSADISRREFVGLGVAGLSIAAVLSPRHALAEDLPLVDPAAHPQASALGYVHDAASVDKAKFAKYEAGQTCANCQFYQAAADTEQGPCLIFPGHSVKAAGWCNTWALKAT